MGLDGAHGDEALHNTQGSFSRRDRPFAVGATEGSIIAADSASKVDSLNDSIMGND